MKKVILIYLATAILGLLGCEGNTTGMYHHKPHNDEPAKTTETTK